MERFFVIIGRINTILITALLLGVGGVLAYFALDKMTRGHGDRVVVTENTAGAKVDPVLEWSPAQAITGVDAHMLYLHTPQSYSKIGSGSGYGGGEKRNVMILSGPQLQARWLFKQHRQLVLDVEEVQEVKGSRTHPALALYVQYVSEDTNKDGALSGDDERVFGLVKPDGSGLQPVLRGVDRVLSAEVSGQERLSLVFARNNTLRHAVVSLADFKLASDREIFDAKAP